MSFKIGADVEDWEGVNENTKFGVGNVIDFLKREYGLDPLITSGKRSAANNANVGGAKNSYHLSGDAADLYLGDIGDDVAETIRQRLSGQGWGEVLYHDAGSGRHLHVANWNGNKEASPATAPYPMDMGIDAQDFLLPIEDIQAPNLGESLLQLAQSSQAVQPQELSEPTLYERVADIAAYQAPPENEGASPLQQQYEIVSNMSKKNMQRVDPKKYSEYFAKLQRKYLV